MFDPDDPRFVSEWDYYAAERERDVEEFHAHMRGDSLAEPNAPNVRLGVGWREEVEICGRTAAIALMSFRERGFDDTKYTFVAEWKSFIFEGKLSPACNEVEDGYPFLRFDIYETHSGGKAFIQDQIDDRGIADELLGTGETESASEIVKSLISALVYDLERESQVWNDSSSSIDDGYKYA